MFDKGNAIFKSILHCRMTNICWTEASYIWVIYTNRARETKKQYNFQSKNCQNYLLHFRLLHFRLLHFRLGPPNRKCNNRKCNTFHKICIKEGLGKTDWMECGVERVNLLLVSYWYIKLNFFVTSSSNIDVDYSSFQDYWN